MKTENTVLTALARAFDAKLKRDFAAYLDERNSVWADRWQERIDQLMAMLPKGSGFDNGTRLDEERSDPDKRMVFLTAFHHMDDHGYYCGWTDHEVIVTPTLWRGPAIRISGVNKRGIKEYIHGVFCHALGADAPDYPWVLSRSRYNWIRIIENDVDTDMWQLAPEWRDKWVDRIVGDGSTKEQPYSSVLIRKDPSAGKTRWIAAGLGKQAYAGTRDDAMEIAEKWVHVHRGERFIL